MNIFFIPSWFPSFDSPLNGIFIHDQIDGITDYYPSISAGVSIWGQKDEATMLYCKTPLHSLKKISNYRNLKEASFAIKPNWTTYYKPAFTWTKKIAGGNIKRIVQANEYNFQNFEKENGKVGLIHAFVTFPGGYIASKLSEKYGIPFVITEEMSPFKPDIFLNLKRKIEEEVILPLKKASTVIAVSPFSANQIRDFVKISTNSIPNMVNEDFFAPQRGLTKNRKFVFFTLGRMVEQKGMPVLLEAIGKTSRQGIMFKIGGGGEEIRKYKALGEQLSLSNIEWLGELDRNQTKLEFQDCDAFVLPSLHESMGVVFAEAIACGKPIIATKCGGPESIVNENNGLLAEVGDSQDLADKIDWMVDNYHKYNAEVIREDFLKRFSRSVVSAQIVDVYKKVIGNKT